MTNRAIADQLRAYATELTRRRDNLYRIRAFRQAAFAVTGLMEPLEDLVRNRGTNALIHIPGIGESVAETLVQYVRTGRWPRV